MKVLSNLKSKICSKKGETLTETLGSLLIIVPAMIMLAGAIVTATNINREMRDTQASNLPSFNAATAATTGIISSTGEVSITDGKIGWYKEDNSVYYYFR